VDGATSDYTLSQVIQQSFLPLSYKYPELVLKLFRNPKLMRPRDKISISENFLRRRNDYIGVTANERFLASVEYVQNMWESAEEKKRRIEGTYNKSRIQAESKAHSTTPSLFLRSVGHSVSQRSEDRTRRNSAATAVQ